MEGKTKRVIFATIAMVWSVAGLLGCGTGDEDPVRKTEVALARDVPEPAPVLLGAVKRKAPTVVGPEGAEIDVNAVQGVVSRRMGAIKGCYEKALRADPDLRGKLTLRFTIDTDGRVTECVAKESELPESVVSCMAERFGEFRFPASGGPATIEMPFLFEPSAP